MRRQTGQRLGLAGAAFLLPLTCAKAQEVVVVPSGQEVRLQEVIQNVPGNEGLAIRYRFVASDLSADEDFDAVTADLGFLCVNYALPRLSSVGPRPEQIIVSLSDREVPFGDPDPEVIQFFGAYRITGDTCEEEAL